MAVAIACRLAVASCQQYEQGYFTAIATCSPTTSI